MFIGSIIFAFMAPLVISLRFSLKLLSRLNNFCPILGWQFRCCMLITAVLAAEYTLQPSRPGMRCTRVFGFASVKDNTFPAHFSLRNPIMNTLFQDWATWKSALVGARRKCPWGTPAMRHHTPIHPTNWGWPQTSCLSHAIGDRVRSQAADI